MTTGDLYPFLEYSITEIHSSQEKKPTTSYFATRETVIDSCIHPKLSPPGQYHKKKQTLLRFLASQEPCCIWEKENDSLYISSAGYKAIILCDKMLLIDSPQPLTQEEGGPLYSCCSYTSFYKLFLRLCLSEYQRQLESRNNLSIWETKRLQMELDMLSAQLSILVNNNNNSSISFMESQQYDPSLFQELYEWRIKVRCYQNKREWKELLMDDDHHRWSWEKTRLIVYSFLFNTLLCAILIGSTSANSFGTNLNIPLYKNSAHGPKACLWYLVSSASIIVASCCIFFFFRYNKRIRKYYIAEKNIMEWDETETIYT